MGRLRVEQEDGEADGEYDGEQDGEQDGEYDGEEEEDRRRVSRSEGEEGVRGRVCPLESAL